MVITKRKDLTKQGFCKILKKETSSEGYLIISYLCLSVRGGVGAYSRQGACSNKYGNPRWFIQQLEVRICF